MTGSINRCPPSYITAEYTKLMVMGGLSASYDTEVINLSDDGKTCDKPFNSPVKESGVGIYFDGFPLICGGIVGSALSSACYRYNAQVMPQMGFALMPS